MIEREYIDSHGIKRRVALPDEHADVNEGVPLSVILDHQLLERGHSIEFIKNLYNELWAVGLITPNDFEGNTALEKIKQAIQQATRTDANAIRALALAQTRKR